jgi:uncharacterized ferredoxin-like protein
LLWGISWINVTLFIADAARTKDEPKSTGEDDINISLESEDAIKKYIDNML